MTIAMCFIYVVIIFFLNKLTQTIEIIKISVLNAQRIKKQWIATLLKIGFDIQILYNITL